MPCWSHSCHPSVWLGPLLATKLSVNHFRKLLRGSPVCFLSLAPDGSTPSVPASLPLWQEAEQLGVSPLSSTSVTPALGCGFELPAAAPRCCTALLGPLLPHCTHPSLAASAHGWCSQVMAMKLLALKPCVESVSPWGSSSVNLP